MPHHAPLVLVGVLTQLPASGTVWRAGQHGAGIHVEILKYGLVHLHHLHHAINQMGFGGAAQMSLQAFVGKDVDGRVLCAPEVNGHTIRLLVV